jgi:hypothetical protein
MTPVAVTDSMTPAVWIALSVAILTFVVQLVVVVRYFALIGAKIDHNHELTGLKIDGVTARVGKLERKIEVGKVVILRRPKDSDAADDA